MEDEVKVLKQTYTGEVEVAERNTQAMYLKAMCIEAEATNKVHRVEARAGQQREEGRTKSLGDRATCSIHDAPCTMH